MSVTDTKERILDSAEYLFARKGFHNTSLRAITGRAGVNLASVNYHFGSKEALLEAVFERRLLPLNDLRRRRLEEVRERAGREGRRPAVRDVLRAFFEPTIAFRDSGPGARDFITLVGRAMTDPDDVARNLFIRHITPLLHLLFEVLCEALPEIPRDVLFERLQFTFGTLVQAIHCTDKADCFPEGVCSRPDAGTLTERILDFVIPGMVKR